ncbi:hypothetical protein GW17_00045798 [Ensete ventricosum]|nr:hypothetical protein GW17_00045798 [Ensete ventricosum]
MQWQQRGEKGATAEVGYGREGRKVRMRLRLGRWRLKERVASMTAIVGVGGDGGGCYGWLQEGTARTGRNSWPEIRSHHDQAERWGASMAAVQRMIEGWAAAAKGTSNSRGGYRGSNCCCGWSHRQRRLRLREEETEEADATTPAPVTTPRGCGRGRRRCCEATVEEAATLAFGVAEVIGGAGSKDAGEISIDLVLDLDQHDDSGFRRGSGALDVIHDEEAEEGC